MHRAMRSWRACFFALHAVFFDAYEVNDVEDSARARQQVRQPPLIAALQEGHELLAAVEEEGGVVSVNLQHRRSQPVVCVLIAPEISFGIVVLELLDWFSCSNNLCIKLSLEVVRSINRHADLCIRTVDGDIEFEGIEIALIKPEIIYATSTYSKQTSTR